MVSLWKLGPVGKNQGEMAKLPMHHLTGSVEIANGALDIASLAATRVIVTQRLVWVVGEVVKPGYYAAVDNASFLKLIGAAGGLTAFADKESIWIRHPDGTTNNIRLSTSADKGIEYPIRPGDVLEVPRKGGQSIVVEKSDSTHQP